MRIITYHYQSPYYTPHCMKNFTLIWIAALALVLSGCSKYAMVSFNYPLPPQENMPENVKTIALVNRSLTNKDDKAGKIIESVLSGEIEVSDRKASEQCIRGAFERIEANSEFRCVIPADHRLYGTGTREIPLPLDWPTVEGVCNTSDADALLVLEMFDSNSDMFSLGKILAPKAGPERERTFNILMYWRLYDPSIKKVIDQYETSRQVTFHSDGESVAVPPKALHGAAYSAGQEYIERFLPGFFIVNRMLFKKGKGAGKLDFKSAYRHVETNDWEGAADAWEEIMKGQSFENKGRACLNMAVYFEHIGNIEEAMKWARRAYVEFGIKQGRDYEASLRSI